MSYTREDLARRSDDQISVILDRVANRVAKWRSTFASWQLGTRADTDGEIRALRDHRELTIMLRAEVNALTALGIEKGLFTARELTEQMILELEHLDSSYAAKFPGFSSEDDGMGMQLPEALETMKNLGFPP